MKDFCFVFAIDEEKYQHDMASLLILSIRKIYKDIDIICNIFNSSNYEMKLENDFIKLLHDNNIKVEIYFSEINKDIILLKKQMIKLDNKFIKNDKYKINHIEKYYIRQYAKNASLSKLNNYKYIIYLDNDVVLLKPLNDYLFLNSNETLIEPMPDSIKLYERKYNIKYSKNTLIFNWLDIIHKGNCYIFDDKIINIGTYEKHSDILLSNRISNSKLKKIQNKEIYYPFKMNNINEACLCHYDSLEERGSLFVLDNKFKDELNFLNLVDNTSKEKHFKEFGNLL